MATATRTPTAAKPLIAAGLAALALLFLVVALIAAVAGSDLCDTDSGDGPSPSAEAKNTIPADYLRLYQLAGQRYDIDWAFLASIGAQECDHGRCPGVNDVNGSGCVGPMQLGVGAQCGRFFQRNKQDGNGDGRSDPRNPADAIFTAAYGLRHEIHAPPIGGSFAAYRQAACGYYGACVYIVPYADQVMARAVAYGFQGGRETPADAADPLVGAPSDESAAAGCPADLSDTGGGVAGKVKIAPDANFPGQPIQPVTIRFLERMAGIAGRELVVTTGTRHSVSTVNGNRSDHADGYAADLGMTANGGTDDSPVGDRIMAACLIAAGVARDRAIQMARAGGLYTLVHAGLRIQCIWKTYAGGNHHNHVHAAARPAA